MKPRERSRSSDGVPRVSIGLPVYNGENYLEEAIESILQQTFEDIELIISDNASTDGTAQICRHYAGLDKRVRYHRLPKNLGAAANFNEVFKLASGEYFKWAAHDDRLAPGFVGMCVDVLDSNKDCVLAFSRVRVIGNSGEVIEDYNPTVSADSVEVSLRFGNMIQLHKCFEIFGLIRRDALQNTPLMGAYANGDGVLLARLSLFGRFIEVPKPLFFPRRHDAQSMAILSKAMSSREYSDYAEWFDPKLSGKLVLPYWRMLWEFFLSVGMAPLQLDEKLRCYNYVAIKAWRSRRRLFGDLRYAVRRAWRQTRPATTQER